MSELRVLAEFISNLELGKIPDEVVKAAQYCVLDSMGAAIGAAYYEEIPRIVEEILPWCGECSKKGSSVWGYNQKIPVFQAALINGMMAHALELDDVHTLSKTHIGAVVIPAAWSLAEALGSTGEELLEAVIAGYETMARIGSGIGVSSHRLKGWHSTGTAGTFGSAAAAARLLKLNKEQTISALGMAGTQSSGLWAFLGDGASSKKLHTGRAAVNGIISAFLAKAGMTGPEHILDAQDGGLFKATSDSYDYSLVTKELGEKFEIMFVDKKPYSSCRSSHPPIDAILKIKDRYGLNTEEINKITVDIYEVGAKQCGSLIFPQNALEGKFSIPFIVAVALLDGEVMLKQFGPDKFMNEEVKNLANKVSVHSAERFTKMYPEQWGCSVTVQMADGTTITEEVTDASGSVKNPLSKEQEKNKFLLLVKPVLGSDKAQGLMKTILKIKESSCIPSTKKFEYV